MTDELDNSSWEMQPDFFDGVSLYAPVGFWLMNHDDRNAYGCGPGRFGDWVVPDTFYGLRVWICCAIHDYMYGTGKTRHDKHVADLTFLQNLLDLIDAKSNFIMKPLRRYRAMTYFSAVRDGGDESFWKGKNKA